MLKTDLKKALIVVHDLVATALAVFLTFEVRFEGFLLSDRLALLPSFLPFFVVYAGIVYWFFALYQSRWRFASLPDLFNIFRATTVLALTLLVVDYVLVSPDVYGLYFFGKITIALYWLLQMALLGGPRLAYRYAKYASTQKTIAREAHTPTILLGRGGEVEVILRAIEAGSLQKLDPKAILSPRSSDQGQSIRGVQVMGDTTDLERVVRTLREREIHVRRLVAAPSALSPDAKPELLLGSARRLGLVISRLNSLGEDVRDAEMAPLEIEDLLLRPTVETDRPRLEAFLRGKRVLVTGGGGSIGSEICTRVVTFGASDLLILEHSEPALHQILENPALTESGARIDGVIADVRDRARIHAVMADFRPDLVFHAAALKHVPYLEKDWTEGIRTNVFGSVNVADAAAAAGVGTLVVISTDKAIDPVSMLGTTKRFSEMYAQALDAERQDQGATRLVAVRFGNVLGSVGSVVPKFKAQIARGGPLTVTHPDMVRYFMTVREACDLVLTAGSHADREGRADAASTPGERASVYVLKMGQPVRIYELAERMIRLAGFEPGNDIEIRVTGSRPGERLNEILFAQEEPKAETGIDGVMAAKPIFADRPRMEAWLAALAAAVTEGDRRGVERVFEEAIPEFKHRAESLAPRLPDQPLSSGAVSSQGA